MGRDDEAVAAEDSLREENEELVLPFNEVTGDQAMCVRLHSESGESKENVFGPLKSILTTRGAQIQSLRYLYHPKMKENRIIAPNRQHIFSRNEYSHARFIRVASHTDFDAHLDQSRANLGYNKCVHIYFVEDECYFYLTWITKDRQTQTLPVFQQRMHKELERILNNTEKNPVLIPYHEGVYVLEETDVESLNKLFTSVVSDDSCLKLKPVPIFCAFLGQLPSGFPRDGGVAIISNLLQRIMGDAIYKICLGGSSTGHAKDNRFAHVTLTLAGLRKLAQEVIVIYDINEVYLIPRNAITLATCNEYFTSFENRLRPLWRGIKRTTEPQNFDSNHPGAQNHLEVSYNPENKRFSLAYLARNKSGLLQVIETNEWPDLFAAILRENPKDYIRSPRIMQNLSEFLSATTGLTCANGLIDHRVSNKEMTVELSVMPLLTRQKLNKNLNRTIPKFQAPEEVAFNPAMLPQPIPPVVPFYALMPYFTVPYIAPAPEAVLPTPVLQAEASKLFLCNEPRDTEHNLLGELKSSLSAFSEIKTLAYIYHPDLELNPIMSTVRCGIFPEEACHARFIRVKSDEEFNAHLNDEKELIRYNRYMNIYFLEREQVFHLTYVDRNNNLDFLSFTKDKSEFGILSGLLLWLEQQPKPVSLLEGTYLLDVRAIAQINNLINGARPSFAKLNPTPIFTVLIGQLPSSFIKKIGAAVVSNILEQIVGQGNIYKICIGGMNKSLMNRRIAHATLTYEGLKKLAEELIVLYDINEVLLVARNPETEKICSEFFKNYDTKLNLLWLGTNEADYVDSIRAFPKTEVRIFFDSKKDALHCTYYASINDDIPQTVEIKDSSVINAILRNNAAPHTYIRAAHINSLINNALKLTGRECANVVIDRRLSNKAMSIALSKPTPPRTEFTNLSRSHDQSVVGPSPRVRVGYGAFEFFGAPPAAAGAALLQRAAPAAPFFAGSSSISPSLDAKARPFVPKLS